MVLLMSSEEMNGGQCDDLRGDSYCIHVSQFDSDYADFQLQVQALFQSLQSVLDFWFHQHVTVSSPPSELKPGSYAVQTSTNLSGFQTERLLELLALFESGPTARLDLKQYYLLLLQRYAQDLELLRKTYQKQKERPPIGRNLPPVETPF